MANTTNLNLVKLSGSEKLKTYPTNQAGNMDTIDSAFGAGFGLSGNPSVNTSINNLADGLAIVANGNTHAAITSGQYVYVRNHGNLSEGLYKATANISANATLSGSNLTADSDGGLNSVYATLNSNFSNYYTKSQSLANNPITGSFTTDNENSYNTAGTTCVYCNRTIAGIGVNQWFTLIVSGVASVHLEQLLVSNNLIFKRVYESGAWGNWSGGRLT